MPNTQHPTPPPKVPEHLSTDTPPKNREDKIDKQMQDTFPASDPPSYSGGNHVIGAPTGRESTPPSGDDPAIKEAERKLKEEAAKPSAKA
jgi:hypothetical protein